MSSASQTYPVDPEVTLVQITDDALAKVAAAARVCYAQDESAVLKSLDSAEPEKDAALIRRVIDMGHLSVIEHISLSFLVRGVSRAMTHQLVRHRLASYSQRSQRYVAEDGFGYIVPPRLKGKTVETEDGTEVDAVEYFAQTMDMLADRYARLNDALGRTGESSNQDARYVLPNACETTILITMNARELIHFFGERLCTRAQWEIRRVTKQMLALAQEACPVLFERAGPKCVFAGFCPEGEKTCGFYAARESGK